MRAEPYTLLDTFTSRFWWWDDAVRVAQRRAAQSGRRFRVRLERSPYTGSMRWTVREVGAA